MTGTRFMTTFLAVLVVFVVLDAIWLSQVAIDMFKRELGTMLRPDPSFAAIIPFYLIYAVALTALAVLPAADENVWGAMWRGALFGLAAYATYDLTNLATLRGWSLALATKDIAWGTFASTIAAIAGYYVAARGS